MNFGIQPTTLPGGPFGNQVRTPYDPRMSPAVAPSGSPGGYGGGFSDVRSQIAQAMMPRYGAQPPLNRNVPFAAPRMGIQQPLRGSRA